MEQGQGTSAGPSLPEATSSAERVVYLIAAGDGSSQDEVKFSDVLRVLWSQKILIALITGVFLCSALAYVLLTKPWYRAEVLLAPAAERVSPPSLGPLGGLAGLVGIGIGGGGNAEPLAVLESREFTSAFIEDEKLITVLLANRWDEEANRWRDPDPEDQPDLRDAVEFFDRSVRRVKEDINSKLVTLTIDWTDPELAAQWANTLVHRLNERMRQSALVEAEANVEYLRNELSNTTVVALQQSIGRLLEQELQKLMLARGNEEFSFRVIDRAVPPKYPSAPRVLLIFILSGVLGLVVAIFSVFIRHASRSGPAVSVSSDDVLDSRLG